MDHSTPLPLSAGLIVMSSSALTSLIDLTGADETTALFFLESSGFNLSAAASAYWEQAAGEQATTAAGSFSAAAAARLPAADSDDVPAPLPAVEEQLYDSQTPAGFAHPPGSPYHVINPRCAPQPSSTTPRR